MLIPGYFLEYFDFVPRSCHSSVVWSHSRIWSLFPPKMQKLNQSVPHQLPELPVTINLFSMASVAAVSPVLADGSTPLRTQAEAPSVSSSVLSRVPWWKPPVTRYTWKDTKTLNCGSTYTDVTYYHIIVHIVEISASMVSSRLVQIWQLLFWPLNCVDLNPGETVSIATASASDD